MKASSKVGFQFWYAGAKFTRMRALLTTRLIIDTGGSVNAYTPAHGLKDRVSELTLKLLLPSDLRNRILGDYVKDHLRETGNTLVNEMSFDQAREEDVAEMHGTTVNGHLFVKVSDKPLGDDELEALYQSGNKNRVYETLVISPNRAEDRRTMPQLIFDNISVIGWFRVRNIEEVMEYLSANHKFGVVFDGSDAYLVSTPRAAPKGEKAPPLPRRKS